MIYVKRVISTIQGSVDLELGPKTLLLGANASGKSRARRAVELALTGSASDISGREEVAKQIDLLALAPPDSNLVARALLSDGTEARFELKRVTAKKSTKFTSSAVDPVRPPSVDVEKCLPLRALKAAILGKPETARKFFLAHTTKAVSRADVLARLPASLHELYLAALAAVPAAVTEPEIVRLLAASDYATKNAGESSRAATAGRKVAVDTGQGLVAPPTEADYTAARTAAATARVALERAVAGYQQQSQRAELESRYATLVAQHGEAAGQLKAAQERLALIEAAAAQLPALPEVPPGQRAVIDAITWHAQGRYKGCFCCDRPVDPAVWPGRVAAVQSELEKTATLTAQHQRKDTLLAGAKFEVEQRADAVRTAERNIEALKTTAQAIMTAGTVDTPLTIEAARGAVEGAEGKLRGMDAARAAWESTRRARDGALDAERQGNNWEQLAKALGEVVRDLLDAGIQNFEARVQLYLPSTDRFGLRLRDGGREVCQFGLYQGGEKLWTALSGAEWARVTAALASVCGPTDPAQLGVVMPEERAFDPETLTAVMRALGKIPHQVLLESPTPPKSVPAGWTVVETAAGYAESWATTWAGTVAAKQQIAKPLA
jgi:hypothetical protein